MGKATFGPVKFVDVRAGEAVARRIPEFFQDARIDEIPELVRPQIEKWLENPGRAFGSGVNRRAARHMRRAR